VLAINVGYSTKESEKKKGRQYDLVAKRVYIFIYLLLSTLTEIEI
jgi:hypothetical protein